MKRLHVNISDEVANSLKAYADAHEVTMTEAIRRAISWLNIVDVEQTKGNNIAILKMKGKKVKSIEKVFIDG